MGRPKLLLPHQGQALVLHTLDAWRQSNVDEVVIVVRADDQPLAELAHSVGANVVIPNIAPPDMKASIRAALAWLGANRNPSPDDCFLIAPADMPTLSAAVINELIAAHAIATNEILAPTLGGHRGHPVLFPWPFAVEVDQLRDDEGVNAILSRHAPQLVPCDHLIHANSDPFLDIDTPDDYERLRRGEDSL